MRNRIVLLGTKGGPALRVPGRMPTANLVELGGRSIIVDCGLGVTLRLVEAGFDLRQLDVIVITHLHSDHLLELGPLLLTAWTTGLARKVTVFGPAGTDAYWQAFLRAMSFDLNIRESDEGRARLVDLVKVRPIAEGVFLDSPALSISAMRVEHPPVTDCFAVRIENENHVITFSADTCHFPPLADFAKGSDILVHEAMLPKAVDALVERTGLGDALRNHLHASHTTAEDAGRIAAAARAGRLVLNHLVPPDDARFTEADWLTAARTHFDGPVDLGHDGMEISLN
ncbi:MAG: MBL fold metallo-hydrolase [Paracoccaceae bacterium]|nr:MBL fold metallo-hydrolase [Paracoccaceae bacterium]